MWSTQAAVLWMGVGCMGSCCGLLKLVDGEASGVVSNRRPWLWSIREVGGLEQKWLLMENQDDDGLEGIFFCGSFL